MAVRRSELREKLANQPQTTGGNAAGNQTRQAAPLRQTHVSDPSPFSRAHEPDPPSPERIAIAAYYRAAARGFEPGHEEEDWLEAERELVSRDAESSR